MWQGWQEFAAQGPGLAATPASVLVHLSAIPEPFLPGKLQLKDTGS